MSKETTIFTKIKNFFLILIFLLLFGAVIGLLITVAFSTADEKEIDPLNVIASEQLEDVEEDVDSDIPDTQEDIDSTTEPLVEDVPLKVGTDIKSGIYKLISTAPTAFYRISTTTEADFIDIKDNDVFSGFTYIQVDDGDFLTLIDSEAIALDDSPNHSIDINANAQNIKYLVGKDINPGNYIVSPEVTYGFVEISTSAIRSNANIVFSSYINKPISIELYEGQFIKISQSKIMLEQ